MLCDRPPPPVPAISAAAGGRSAPQPSSHGLRRSQPIDSGSEHMRSLVSPGGRPGGWRRSGEARAQAEHKRLLRPLRAGGGDTMLASETTFPLLVFDFRSQPENRILFEGPPSSTLELARALNIYK